MRSTVPIAALAAALTLPSHAQQAAEPARLKEVSVSATRTERDVNDVPATVTTIDAQEMERGLVRDIRDLIRYEPGVAVPNDPNRFGASGINIRGLTDNRVLLQVDGVRLPDFFRFSIGPFNTVSRNLVDVDSLKRVEILRGPSSSLYGSDALGGVVTYVTKDPSDYLAGRKEPWYVSNKSTYATVDKSWTNTFTATGANDSLGGLAVITYRDGNEVKTQGTNGSTSPLRTEANPQDIDISNVLLKLVGTPATNHLFRATYERFHNETDTDVLSLNYATPRTSALTGDDRYKRQRAAFDYEYARPGSGWLTAATLKLYWQDYGTTEKSDETRRNTTGGCSGITAGASTCAISRKFEYNQETVGVTATAESRVDWGSSKHRFLHGIDWNRTDYDEKRDATIRNLTLGTTTKSLAGETFPVRDFPDSRQYRLGLFLQDEIALAGGEFELIPAVRYDKYRLKANPDSTYFGDAPPGVTPSDFKDSHVSPKLGAIWHFTEKAQLYANLATGFRAPPYDDLNASFRNPIQSYAIIPNPDLKSETSKGVELGTRADFGRARFGLAGFYNWYKNFIDSQVPLVCPGTPGCVPGFGQTFQSINRAKVEIWGIEARGEVQVARNWTAVGSIAFAHGQDEQANVPLNSIEPLKGVASLRYDTAQWGGAATVTAVHRKDADRIDSSRMTQPPMFKPDGFFLLDATFYWKPMKGMTLTAGVFNLFDKKYWLWADVYRTGIGPNTVAPGNPPAGSIDRYTSPGRNAAVSAKVEF